MGFYVPPEVIAGEVALCSVQAMVALAWVFQRNPEFYGRGAPSGLAIAVSWSWWALPDFSRGAEFLFSEADLRDKRVQGIIRGRSLKAEFLCRGGYRVYAF